MQVQENTYGSTFRAAPLIGAHRGPPVQRIDAATQKQFREAKERAKLLDTPPYKPTQAIAIPSAHQNAPAPKSDWKKAKTIELTPTPILRTGVLSKYDTPITQSPTSLPGTPDHKEQLTAASPSTSEPKQIEIPPPQPQRTLKGLTVDDIRTERYKDDPELRQQYELYRRAIENAQRGKGWSDH